MVDNSKAKSNDEFQCVICFKSGLDRSHEHIWPQALGGARLSGYWRTNRVCIRCNNVLGLYADAAFSRSWFGMAERAAIENVSDNEVADTELAIRYLGQVDLIIKEADQSNLDVVEYWVCTKSGIEFLNIFPKADTSSLKDYAKGLYKQEESARAYVLNKGNKPGDIVEAVEMMKTTFDRAILTYCDLETGTVAKIRGNLDDETAARDTRTVNRFLEIVSEIGQIKVTLELDLLLGNRFLAKTAYLLGIELLGTQFMQTPHARNLCRAAREKNPNDAAKLPIHGQNYLSAKDGFDFSNIAKPAFWTILLNVIENKLFLVISTPLGRVMSIVICPDVSEQELPEELQSNGLIWEFANGATNDVIPHKYSQYLAEYVKNSDLPKITADSSSTSD